MSAFKGSQHIRFIIAAATVFACGDSSTGPSTTGTPNVRPTASFTIDISEGSAPLEVAFDASASSDPDGTIVSYAWSFGDGSTGTGRTTSHSYADPGSYTPELTVTDERGATHSLTGTPITVNSPPGTGEGQIHGVVWHDADADGVKDPEEETVPAFVVFLDDDGDGERDPGETAAVTDDQGEYAFDGLDETRSYTVTQELTLGWTNTFPGAPQGIPAITGPVPPSGSLGIQGIIGGSVAAPGEFPFQVALVTSDTQFQFCGGTFIARSWVMTAAHCVDGGTQPSDFKVLAGTNDLNAGGELIDVARFVIHPNFAAQAFVSSDIALIELEGDYMYPRIELLTPDRVELSAPGVLAAVVGWGRTSNSGPGSDVLKRLDVEIISNADCQTQLNDEILDVTICAGMQGASESICNGDSGGPLMVPFRNRWLQVGIVSFGTNICFQPSAFARVSALVDYPVGQVPTERSGAVVVEWTGGVTSATADFGNFR